MLLTKNSKIPKISPQNSINILKTLGKILKLKEKTQNSRKILRFPASLKTIDGRDVHKKEPGLVHLLAS